MSNQEKNALATTKAQDLMSVQITAQDITKYFCPLADEKEVFMALGIINSLKLNPHTREVHLIKYDRASKLAIVVGYEVYLKRAERTGKLAGWSAGIDAANKTAWVEIYRKDWDKPFHWDVSLEEFNKGQSTWKSMPSFMGKKVAIAQGFRLAFPDELGGMPYTTEEAQVYDVTGERVDDAPKLAEPQSKSAKVAETAPRDPAPEPAKPEPAPAPTSASKPEKQTTPSRTLSIEEALAEKPGCAPFNLAGMITRPSICRMFPKKKGGTGYFTIVHLEGFDSGIDVSMFGDHAKQLVEGVNVLLKGIEVKSYKEQNQYLAVGGFEVEEMADAEQ